MWAISCFFPCSVLIKSTLPILNISKIGGAVTEVTNRLVQEKQLGAVVLETCPTRWKKAPQGVICCTDASCIQLSHLLNLFLVNFHHAITAWPELAKPEKQSSPAFQKPLKMQGETAKESKVTLECILIPSAVLQLTKET